ncbi:glycosyltransferase family 4 protein [Desulfohalovibrio reitneri]|uniref:glycosyltransferase family 4 protein n=1 Tax=Desulfohalovibrio reitneri TaxID=1307759 RepID=UPI0004A6DDE6|nr:glycosyltransferase family 4 protein [Desulfohalovibrio reitneri]
MKSDSPVLGMVLKGFPRISETFISNEIALLERSGYRVRIISMRHPRESFSHESVKAIKARVDYLPSTLRGNICKLLAANIRAIRLHRKGWTRAAGLAGRRLLRSRKIATLKHLLQAGWIAARVLPGSGICHLHAHFAHSPTSVTLFTSIITGLPFSFTAHAKDVWTQKPAQLKEKIEQAEFVVTCTEHNREYLAGLTQEGSTPVHRVYHGIDVRLFSPNGGPPTSRPFRILTVARLTTKKGLPTVFRALRRLADQGVDFSYCLVGDGDERERILEMLTELDLAGRTQWLGVQPHDEVMRQLASAHAFVLGCEIAPDGDRDGIPNVLAEAMAMQVPVVATSVSGIPELVESGKNGLLVEPGDSDGMADALRRLLTDKNLRAAILPKARQKVLRDFDNARCAEELIEVYRSHGLHPPAS